MDNREGGTGIRGAEGRVLEWRAQSRGLWFGVRRTFFRGLEGMELWDGGGARLVEVGERFGRGEGRGGGAIRFVVGVAFRRGGPRALCAEFAAGNEGGGMLPDALCAEAEAGKEGGDMLFEARCAEFVAGKVVPPDALCAELAAGKEGGGMSSSVPSVRVKDGTAF